MHGQKNIKLRKNRTQYNKIVLTRFHLLIYGSVFSFITAIYRRNM